MKLMRIMRIGTHKSCRSSILGFLHLNNVPIARSEWTSCPIGTPKARILAVLVCVLDGPHLNASFIGSFHSRDVWMCSSEA
jgi:hypothetical protein